MFDSVLMLFHVPRGGEKNIGINDTFALHGNLARYNDWSSYQCHLGFGWFPVGLPNKKNAVLRIIIRCLINFFSLKPSRDYPGTTSIKTGGQGGVVTSPVYIK